MALALAGCSSNAGTTTTGPEVAKFKCAPDIHTVDAILEAVNEHDDGDYQSATQFALDVPPGTPVRVTAHTLGQSPKVRVIVLDGRYKGETCWFPRNIDGILSDT